MFCRCECYNQAIENFKNFVCLQCHLRAINSPAGIYLFKVEQDVKYIQS